MRVAILHSPRPAELAGAVEDAFEEYDDPRTIAAVAGALTALPGIDAVPVAADAEFPWRLREGGFGFVFNMAEGQGRRCREAVPAAICEFLGLPYTGSDALTLAVTLDKATARRVVAPDVPVAPGLLIDDAADEAALATLRYPVIVKPNDEGSSKGIREHSWCADATAAAERCGWLREHYNCPALVETFLPGMEVTVGVRGHGREATVLGAMEIAPAEPSHRPFVYGLEAKRDYQRQVRYHRPPRLSDAAMERLSSLALTAHRLLGCRDIARHDFRLDAAGTPHFLECNPLPGLNPIHSDLIILCGADAEPSRYRGLVQGILHDAARRQGVELPR